MVPGVLPASPSFLASMLNSTSSPEDLLTYYQPLCEDTLLPLKRLIGKARSLTGIVC